MAKRPRRKNMHWASITSTERDVGYKKHVMSYNKIAMSEEKIRNKVTHYSKLVVYICNS